MYDFRFLISDKRKAFVIPAVNDRDRGRAFGEPPLQPTPATVAARHGGQALTRTGKLIVFRLHNQRPALLCRR
jgi:hypothetical protein